MVETTSVSNPDVGRGGSFTHAQKPYALKVRHDRPTTNDALVPDECPVVRGPWFSCLIRCPADLKTLDMSLRLAGLDCPFRAASQTSRVANATKTTVTPDSNPLHRLTRSMTKDGAVQVFDCADTGTLRLRYGLRTVGDSSSPFSETTPDPFSSQSVKPYEMGVSMVSPLGSL